MTSSFRFGENDRHEFKIVCGWLGGEKYYVDDRLVSSRWSFSFDGAHEVTYEQHRIRIEVKITLRPRKVISRAYVDGVLKVDDLFPEYSAYVEKQRRKLEGWTWTAWFAKVFVWGLISFTAMTIYKRFF
ncbi:hypothetical protein CDL60_00875 [Roseateles noduli]|nr:hypothetical protein CDL60_00875 [Roseateles noduli]